MKLATAPAVIALVAAGAGCGGGGSTSTASDSLAGFPEGPTREFIVPGGDNAVPLFGREASAEERRQASMMIHKWMRAREAKRFAEECRYFSRAYIQAMVVEDAARVSHGTVKNCPQALAYFGEDASGDYRNTLTGPIDSLRVAEGQGFAQYHGNDGINYELPMNKEGGRWWVSKAAPINQEG